jgi:hypothetical protein
MSAFLPSPRALAWLKRQLYLMLSRKGQARTIAESNILTMLKGDPDVYLFFAKPKSVQTPPASGGTPQGSDPAPGAGPQMSPS